ncbi:MAG: AbrB/MazE/SpoVT family DNA-binding domain-containing protein, partial [Nanoarchaeota archaeon]|nr:AbrB/MazE/SpoVT family DNA-binding domain-containing protein [Nanoarchaeota archaeon]MBU1704877.1 AbrB/MazE/SpoVT family DNA-binding domain-containing protein [Nanoarchaeota archaeon]
LISMKRKLVKQGDNALTITLPASWTKQFSLKPGDEIEVVEKEPDLLITTGKGEAEQRVSVDVSGKEPMIRRILSSCYKAGFDEVEVLFNTAEELKEIQWAFDQEFIAFEIVEQSRKAVIGKRISNIEPNEFDVMMRRTFLFLLQMAEDSLESIKEQDFEDIKQIGLRDRSINKFTDFCRRVLNKRVHVKYKRTNPLYYIVEEIEKTGDGYRDICNYVAENKVTLSKKTLTLYGELNKFIRMFYEAFYKFDLEKIAAFGKARYAMKDTFQELLKTADKKESMVLFYLFMIFNAVFDMNGPLMAVNL